MAHPGKVSAFMDMPGWKSAANWIAAVIIAGLFLSAGLWEITDIPGVAAKLNRALVPQNLSLLAALLLGIGNTFTGLLVLVPRYRRRGACLASFLLVVFVLYFALHYGALRGEECGCFPWIRGIVGPGFFVSDAAMLALAAVSGLWAPPGGDFRGAVLILGAVTVFALVSYGVEITRKSGIQGPVSTRGMVSVLAQDRSPLHRMSREGDVGQAPRLRTGALAGPPAEGRRFRPSGYVLIRECHSSFQSSSASEWRT